MLNKNASRFLLVALIATTVAAASDDASDKQQSRPRVRFGGLMAGVGYSSGPWWYPRYGYGYGYGIYDPIYYSPYIHPGFYNGFLSQPNMGQVKLGTEAKDASVYVDGAYAGPAHKLKSMWLAPGVYNLELRDTKQQAFRQKVYVLSGKTLAIRATLQRDSDKEAR